MRGSERSARPRDRVDEPLTARRRAVLESKCEFDAGEVMISVVRRTRDLRRVVSSSHEAMGSAIDICVREDRDVGRLDGGIVPSHHGERQVTVGPSASDGRARGVVRTVAVMSRPETTRLSGRRSP